MEKSETTLFSQTFEVAEKKVHLLFFISQVLNMWKGLFNLNKAYNASTPDC